MPLSFLLDEGDEPVGSDRVQFDPLMQQNSASWRRVSCRRVPRMLSPDLSKMRAEPAAGYRASRTYHRPACAAVFDIPFRSHDGEVKNRSELTASSNGRSPPSR